MLDSTLYVYTIDLFQASIFIHLFTSTQTSPCDPLSARLTSWGLRRSLAVGVYLQASWKFVPYFIETMPLDSKRDKMVELGWYVISLLYTIKHILKLEHFSIFVGVGRLHSWILIQYLYCFCSGETESLETGAC